MIGFKHLSVKIENSIISSHYNHLNSSIFKGLYFFMNNIFYTEKQKQEILYNFYRVQKTRYVLLNAIKKYKIKKKSVNTCDLMMIPFTDYRDNFKIYINENEKIYTFYLPNLMKLWKKNIFQSDFMIINPINLKNPYTNTIFNINTLNYIYISAFKEMLIIPSCITESFKVQFRKIDFINNYGTILQENAIISFVSPDNLELFRDIIFITQLYPTITYNINTNIIDVSLQRELIKDMKNLILLYYGLTYSTNFVKKESARINFVSELKEYNETIPMRFRNIEYSDTEDESELYDSPLFTNEHDNYSSGNEELHNLLS